MSGYPTQPCKSCTRPIIWAVTKNGHPMPVDPVAIDGGNLELQRQAGLPPRANIIPPREAGGRQGLRRSHFASCPDAARWRKEGRPA